VLQHDAVLHLLQPEAVLHWSLRQSLWHADRSPDSHSICTAVPSPLHCFSHLSGRLKFAEPHKPNCRTSQAKLQNLTSQIAEPQKPNCGTSQANLQNLTSQIAEPHKPDCRTPQANLQNLTSQSDSDRQLVTLEYQHRHDSHAEGILASASTILGTTLSNIW